MAEPQLITELVERFERNRILAGQCRASLQRNIDHLAPPATVTSALLVANLGIGEYRACAIRGPV